MSEPGLELLFERWRARGDLAALAAVFDRTARDLLGLAAHLVRDPVEAEDLVQATFVAALEGAAAFDPARRLEPWLAGILVRKAARVQRERARRPDPERLVHATVDPARAAEQRELAARLQQALAELDEPYRSVLAAHLEGTKPHAIARDLGRAPGTVRMQLLRGLERLRGRLPASLLALVPVRIPRGLDALRADVLASGAGAAAPPAALTVAGAAVSSKLVLAGVAAAAVGLVLFVVSERAPSAAPPRAALDPDIASLRDGAALIAPPVLTDAPAPARARAPAPAASIATKPATTASEFPVPEGRTGFFLVGQLHGLEGADPTQVSLTAGPNGSITGFARDDGRFALDVTRLLEVKAPEFLLVTAEHPEGHHAYLEHPLDDAVRAATAYERTEIRVDLHLVRRTIVWGRVRSPEGVDPRMTQVALLAAHELEGDFRPVERQALCNAEGYFRIVARGGGEHVLVARARRTPPVVANLRVVADALNDAGELVLRPGGASIDGVVRFPFHTSSRPSVSARRIGAAGEWCGIQLRPPTFDVAEESALVAEDGSFRIEGLSPGPYQLVLDQAAGALLSAASVTVTAPATGVEIGSTFDRTRVVIRTHAVRRLVPSLAVSGDGFAFERSAKWDEPTEVIADRRTAAMLTAKATGFREVRLTLAAGRRLAEETLELWIEPDDELAALELEWELGVGLSPPTSVTVTFRPLDGSDGPRAYKASVEGGRCRFENQAPGRYEIHVEPSKTPDNRLTSFLSASDLEVELVPGATARARVEWTAGGRARFLSAGRPFRELGARVSDARGNEVRTEFVSRWAVGGSVRSHRSVGNLSDGQSELEVNLPPGDYVLVLSERHVERLRVPFTIVAGAVVDVPFELP
jgi:RNA polymerase sigma-70 factor (ECF subfamily)